jgi:hypothetical protein
MRATLIVVSAPTPTPELARYDLTLTNRRRLDGGLCAVGQTGSIRQNQQPALPPGQLLSEPAWPQRPDQSRRSQRPWSEKAEEPAPARPSTGLLLAGYCSLSECRYGRSHLRFHASLCKLAVTSTLAKLAAKFPTGNWIGIDDGQVDQLPVVTDKV